MAAGPEFMAKVAKVADKRGLRLLCATIAFDPAQDGDVRRLALLTALGWTEKDLERAVEALADAGIGEIKWLQ